MVGRLHSPLLVLDLGLYVVDGIRWLHLEGDSLSGQSLNEDLHNTECRRQWRFEWLASLLTSGIGCGCGCGCGEEAVDSAAVVLGQRSEFESGEMFIANK